jgi:hypothetical protein
MNTFHHVPTFIFAEQFLTLPKCSEGSKLIGKKSYDMIKRIHRYNCMECLPITEAILVKSLN